MKFQSEPFLGTDNKYHFVYITKIEGKFYIGKHSTSDLNDGYVGSGVAVVEAKERDLEISSEPYLFFETSNDAYRFEELFVCEELLKEDFILNRVVGGKYSYHGKSMFETPKVSKSKITIFSNKDSSLVVSYENQKIEITNALVRTIDEIKSFLKLNRIKGITYRDLEKRIYFDLNHYIGATYYNGYALIVLAKEDSIVVIQQNTKKSYSIFINHSSWKQTKYYSYAFKKLHYLKKMQLLPDYKTYYRPC